MWLRPKLPGVLALSTCLSLGGFGVGIRPARATPPSTLSLGDVKISGDAGVEGAAALELGQALRVVLSDELAQVAKLGSPKRPLIVSATITRFSSERMAEASKASAAVSLALLRADDRALFAELRGRASVEEASGNVAALRSVALRRAARRAMERLPEAVQRSD